MFGKKTFGKLGNRSAARLEISLEVGLATRTQSLSYSLENVSATGCRFIMDGSDRDTPLRVGAEVLVKFERVEEFGQIAWIRDGSCGVKFAKPLPEDKLARLRWIVEHPDQHQQNVANSAASRWR